MRPKKHETTGSGDLFRARLEQIINMKHDLVLLAGKPLKFWNRTRLQIKPGSSASNSGLYPPSASTKRGEQRHFTRSLCLNRIYSWSC